MGGGLGVKECAVFAHRDGNLFLLLAGRHHGQNLVGDVGQQRVSKNVVDVASAAFDFSTASGDGVEHRVVVDKGHGVVLFETPLDFAEFEADDLLEGGIADGVVRDDDHAAEEGRFEDLVEFGLDDLDDSGRGGGGFEISRQLHDLVGGGVGGEDDDRIFEIDLAAFAVFHLALVEDLEEEFEDVGVGFFDFVEQNDRIGPTTNGFGEDAAFAVANVSRGRAFQSGDGMGFLELAHVDGDHVAFPAIEKVGEGERGFGFPNAGGADEHEDPDGLVGIFHLGLGNLDALGDGIESVILTDDALGELRG